MVIVFTTLYSRVNPSRRNVNGHLTYLLDDYNSMAHPLFQYWYSHPHTVLMQSTQTGRNKFEDLWICHDEQTSSSFSTTTILQQICADIFTYKISQKLGSLRKWTFHTTKKKVSRLQASQKDACIWAWTVSTPQIDTLLNIINFQPGFHAPPAQKHSAPLRARFSTDILLVSQRQSTLSLTFACF